MTAIEIFIVFISIAVTLGYMRGARLYASAGKGINISTINTIQLFLIWNLFVLFGEISVVSLLWLLPLTWFVGMLSPIFPFSLLSAILWGLTGQFFAKLLLHGIEIHPDNKNISKEHIECLADTPTDDKRLKRELEIARIRNEIKQFNNEVEVLDKKLDRSKEEDEELDGLLVKIVQASMLIKKLSY